MFEPLTDPISRDMEKTSPIKIRVIHRENTTHKEVEYEYDSIDGAMEGINEVIAEAFKRNHVDFTEMTGVFRRWEGFLESGADFGYEHTFGSTYSHTRINVSRGI